MLRPLNALVSIVDMKLSIPEVYQKPMPDEVGYNSIGANFSIGSS